MTMRVISILLVVTGLIVWLGPPHVLAHRGEEHSEQTAPLSTPFGKFPGHFNTHTVERGKFVFELPTFSADYGITENLTVGTSALPIVYSAINASPLLYLKARYRFFSSRRLMSSVTLYGAGWWNTRARPVQLGDGGNLVAGTSNTSIFLDYNKILTLHLGVTHFSTTRDLSENLSAHRSFDMISPGLGYEMFFSEKFGMELQAFVPVWVRLLDNNPAARTLVRTNYFGQWPLAFRAAVNFKTTQNSVLTLGILTGLFTQSDPAFLPMNIWLNDFTQYPLPVVSWSLAL